MEGMLDLHGVLNVKGEVCGKVKSVVTLTTKLRDWSFGASNDAEMNEWVTLLKNILASLDSEHALVRVPKGTEDGQGTVVNSLDELPEEAKVIVRGMGFTREQIQGPKEFPILLNILGYQIGQRLTTTANPNTYVTPENTGVGGTQYTTDAVLAGRRWVQETNARTFEKTYKVGQKLGEGGYGTVFQAQRGKDKKAQVAIKKSENREDRARATNLRELYFLMTLENPSIVKCFDCYDMKEQGQMWCVLEYMDGGTLTQARKNHVWTPAEVAFISRELFKSVAFLHSNKVMHRDIKSSNVMFTCEGEVKLIDFGLATHFPEDGQLLKGMIGSAFWIAPEMIRGCRHDHKSDIWASGMCLFELVNGHIPHYEESKASTGAPPGVKGSRAMFLVGTGTVVPFENPDAWNNADVQDFFRLLQEFDPVKRQEASQLVQHKYHQQASDQASIKKMLQGVFRGAALAMF